MKMKKLKKLSGNSLEIETEKGAVLVSYETLVAKKEKGGIILSSRWDCSRTTTKHVSQWLGIPAKEIRSGTKEGKIKIGKF